MSYSPKLGEFQTLFSEMVIGRTGLPSEASGLNKSQQQLLQAVDHRQHAFFTKRCAVYRNNVHHSLVQALADSFPVVQQLVGEDFFTLMAKEYLYLSPPQSPVLLEFGAQFPEFVRRLEAAESLAYLADVASLELLWQQAYHGADAPSVDGQYFADIPAESLYESSPVCHPTLQLIHSEYSIGSIWQAHQDQQTNEQLNIEGPEWLIVVRPEYEVHVYFMDEPGYRFIERLAQGERLGAVITELSESFPEWDIGQTMAFAIQNGFFVAHTHAHKEAQ